jgi:hypothetical protein
MGNNPCPLWATTLVLCGQQPLSSVEQQPLSSVGQPLSSVGHTTICGWFDLFVRYWDESLWFLVKVAGNHLGGVVCVAALDPAPFNELIFSVRFLVSTHVVTRLLYLMNLTCRLLSAVKL